MENASKALIIAGAILLSILIIAIGMYIYNSSQNSIRGAGDSISAYEVQSFNQNWEMYEGVQTGTNVRALISKMSANASSNATEENRLPDLWYQPTSSHADKKTGGYIESKVTNPQGTPPSTFDHARQMIEARHQYKVFLIQNSKTSLVSGIIITYNTNYNSVEDFLKEVSNAHTAYKNMSGNTYTAPAADE